MILHLVRHGETAHNRDGRGLGRDDVPLTPTGELQAEASAAALASPPVTVIFSSPLQRAKATADHLARHAGVPVQVRDALIEMDVGDTEGLAFAEMRERYPAFMEAWRAENAHTVTMPGGESLQDVADRLDPFLDEVRQIEGDAVVAVVSHNFIERVLICRLLGLPLAAFRSFAIDLASITSLSIQGERVRMLKLNDTCHLHLLESSGNQT